MAVPEQEMQEEFDAIIANIEERIEVKKAVQNRAEFLDDPANEFMHGAQVGIAQTAGIPVDVVNYFANVFGVQADAPVGSGDNIQDVLALIADMPEGLPDEPEGILGGAGEGIGIAAVMTPAMLAPFIEDAMDPNFDLNQRAAIGKFQGTGPDTPGHIPRSRAARMAFALKQIGQNITRTAVKNPKMFAAGELLGAAGAGAAVEYAAGEDASPGVQAGAGMAAGVVGGLMPTAIPRVARNMARWGMRNILPFTQAGAESRAATQMQARTADPEAAADAVRNIPRGPDGEPIMTPARATGEDVLIAQEARVLEDDIVLDKQVREDLTEAIKRANQELRSLYDTPPGKQSWEQAIFQRVAPDGVEIRAGTSEEMLDQLFDEFKPLYAELRGFPIRPQIFSIGRNTPLEVMIKNSPKSNRVHAEDKPREAVARRLKSMWSGFSRKLKSNDDGVVVADSADYLKFRQQIRAEGRKRAKSGDTESAALYSIAEEKINQVLKSQLEPELLQRLGVIDSHYRDYKVAEDAMYRTSASDKGLTPEGLLMALKQSASSKGNYARGDNLELRSAAVSGKPVAKYIDDIDTLRRNVARMGEDDLKRVQDDMFDVIYKKSIDPNDINERVSGERLKRQLVKYDEQMGAAKMDEATIARAHSIADELMSLEKMSPTAVAELYEDGPSNILQLVATIAGAQRGQKVAEGGVGSSMVLAGYFANKARSILGHFTTDQATQLLVGAQTDPELYIRLLTKPDIAAVKQTEAASYLRTWLKTAGEPVGEEAKEYYEKTYQTEKEYNAAERRRELDRLRSIGTNF